MSRHALLLAFAITAAVPAAAFAQAAPQTATQSPFTFEEVMVPLRDGAKLQPVIMRPHGLTRPLPILLQRTPYGVPDAPFPNASRFGPLMKDGYIFVFQSMRGRFKSDGVFTLSTAVHPNDPKAVDEATDAYDTVGWLVKNVPANTGKVGMGRAAPPGGAAAGALANPHPALKAGAPQAAAKPG